MGVSWFFIPEKYLAVESEWAEPRYKEPEDSPMNAKCQCRHPKRQHEGMCMIVGCSCVRFLKEE